MPEKPQEGTLSSGMQVCPTCGHDEKEIEVEAVVKTHIHFFSEGEHELVDTEEGDLAWEDSNPARCKDCTWAGQVGELGER
jgi:protein-arginine kinase activator protein McsA